MPRKPICRKIECYPDYWTFSPEDREEKGSIESIILSLDEYETIRSIDRNGLTQEQCAEKMGVARTTVTYIYDSARKKLAEALIDGKRLQISGGHYKLTESVTYFESRKGENTMRIAITYENGEIFQHFGHTEQFKLYDVEEDIITSEQILDTNGNGHGALAGFLKQHEVDVLICGGIGAGAQNALAEAGIKIYGGASGSADAAVQALINGTLKFNPDVKCNHHGHNHEHSHDHECGHHSCESHACHSKK